MGATTKQQENGNAATKPNENGMQTEQWETMWRRQGQTKKGPRDVV